MEQENQPKETDTNMPEKKQSRRFLVVYIIGLFSVALVLILLSYLTQVRANRQLESMKTQVSEQTNVAQGAQQQMVTLQNTLEEQRKKLDELRATLQAIETMVGTKEDEKTEDAVKRLQERYIALDALQQVRRLDAAENDAMAKELLQKMIDSYGVENLTLPDKPDSLLLGANAAEFTQYCTKYGITI